MINSQMRLYNYYIYGENDSYGQPALSKDVKGQVKLAINIASQSIQDNINYKDARYVGLTFSGITDKYVIDYEGEKLKVLYINPLGRYKQVFLGAL